MLSCSFLTENKRDVDFCLNTNNVYISSAHQMLQSFVRFLILENCLQEKWSIRLLLGIHLIKMNNRIEMEKLMFQLLIMVQPFNLS